MQTIALQIIADILITHPSLVTSATDPDTTDNDTAAQFQMQVCNAFKKSLKSDDFAVQSTGANALAKTMLSRLITSKDLLKQLVIAYFDPDTASNAHLRQSLPYFLPVYCHSRAENAHNMVSVVVPVVNKLCTLRETLQDEADVEGEDGSEGMVKMSVVAQMLLDWTDPRRIVGFAEAAGTEAAAHGAGETHFILADELLTRLNLAQVGKDERKLLISMLGKLHLPVGGAGGERLGSILAGLTEAQDSKLAADATGRNTLAKLYDALLKQMNAVATAERGGGGAEETVLITTEAPEVTTAGAEATEANIMDSFDGEEEESDVTIQGGPEKTTTRNLDTTIGATTFAGPADAEGTRVQLGVEDSEMMDTEMTDV